MWGGAKCGTSSVSQYLVRHPKVAFELTPRISAHVSWDGCGPGVALTSRCDVAHSKCNHGVQCYVGEEDRVSDRVWPTCDAERAF